MPPPDLEASAKKTKTRQERRVFYLFELCFSSTIVDSWNYCSGYFRNSLADIPDGSLDDRAVDPVRRCRIDCSTPAVRSCVRARDPSVQRPSQRETRCVRQDSCSTCCRFGEHGQTRSFDRDPRIDPGDPDRCDFGPDPTGHCCRNSHSGHGPDSGGPDRWKFHFAHCCTGYID